MFSSIPNFTWIGQENNQFYLKKIVDTYYFIYKDKIKNISFKSFSLPDKNIEENFNLAVLIFINKKLFPAYTRAIFDCVVRKAYNLLTVITSSIANPLSPSRPPPPRELARRLPNR